ncbi:MAG: DUF1566 domain-containing protein [Desulfopila sp.]
MYNKIRVGNRDISPIDWEMTPELSFGTYESWGGRERVRDNSERVYYFFVDDWGEKPKVCLMERAVKHAKVVAEIDVPEELVNNCVAKQGRVARFERSYAVDDSVKRWLIANVLDDSDTGYVREIVEKTVSENMGAPLPLIGEARWTAEKLTLPSQSQILVEEELEKLIRQWNFFDSLRNTSGSFVNHLVDSGDGLTVIDERTGLQWQIGGLDICSLRTMNKKVEDIQTQGWAGFKDWRLPSMEEALSLMNASVNFKGVYLNPCFSIDQPFIFVAARRKPGGYWFVDYKQGRAFYASGTIPGGFGRLCRSLD